MALNHHVIWRHPRVYKEQRCDFCSSLMKTVHRSVKTLGRGYSSTTLWINLLKNQSSERKHVRRHKYAKTMSDQMSQICQNSQWNFEDNGTFRLLDGTMLCKGPLLRIFILSQQSNMYWASSGSSPNCRSDQIWWRMELKMWFLYTSPRAWEQISNLKFLSNLPNGTKSQITEIRFRLDT